ncbi:MAG TPA: R3H domain-containing nucleic acid-binding protein [Polyangiaceae bacterium]
MPTSDDNNELDSSWPEAGEASVAGEGEQDGDNGDNGVDLGAEADDAPRTSGSVEGEVYDEARAENARAFVEALLGKMGMDAIADLVEPEAGDPPSEIRIEIEGRDSGRIIGKKGQVLSAIQHIVNRMVNKPGLDRRHVVVDAEGYRQRREDTLATMAQRLGKKAIEEGKIITFEPMSPRDRRIVHLALAKFPGVVTKSDGEGEGRRVQIIPVRR